MKPTPDKHPVDELFARRLAGAAVTPQAASFAELKKRRRQTLTRTVGIWERTVWAAACLLLLVGIGWLAQQTTQEQPTIGQKIATAPPAAIRPAASKPQPASTGPETVTQQPTVQQPIRVAAEPKPKPQRTAPVEAVASLQTPTPNLVAENTPAKPTENRVLTVTINEPESLVEARQLASSVVNNMPVLAADPLQERKAGLWQKIRKLRQEGPLPDSDSTEYSLVSRAYRSLKNNLEKKKTTKQ